MIFRRFLTGNYSQIDNNLINNTTLSWKAKGILVYLLSKPGHWRPKVADIMNHATDGRDSVLSGIHELEEQHYVWKIRTSRNGFSCCEYWVYDIQVHENPSLKSENPESENPTSENPVHSNTRTESNIRIESNIPTGYGGPRSSEAPADPVNISTSKTSARDVELFPVEMTGSEPSRETPRNLSNPSCQKSRSDASKETPKSQMRSKRLSVPNTQSSGQKEFLELWCKGYLSAKGRPYVMAYGKDNAAVKRLLSAGLTKERLIELAKVAWASSNAYIFGLAADISKFASNINTIADEADKNMSPRNNGCEFQVY